MAGKYKLQLKKVGGSIYCHIPAGLVDQLDIKQDTEILASFEKYGDIVRELCKKHCNTGEQVIITDIDDKEIVGEIMFTNPSTIDFMSEGKTYRFQYSLIKLIKPIPSKQLEREIPSKDGLNHIKLNEEVLK